MKNATMLNTHEVIVKNIRSSDMKIVKEKFDKNSADSLTKKWFGANWPVVYILKNKSEAYIGETISISNRMKQHLENEQRHSLNEAHIIVDKRFNKSAVLDIESKLIEYMSADKKFKLQNSNSGLRNHEYYEKILYESLFKSIWDELRKKKLVKHELDFLINSDLFKYTPYKRLTDEQYDLLYELVLDLLVAIQLNETSTTVINGEVGTGKTVLAMYLLKLFADNRVLDFISNEDEYLQEKFKNTQEKLKNFKIALVVPMTSLRGTLKKVARNITGLKGSMIIGPNDVMKDDYDLLIVDESHRLYRRVGITSYGTFDIVNEKLNLDKKHTQLDWIRKRSNHQVFFYDPSQSIRPSDVRKEDFYQLKNAKNYSHYNIKSQLRVLGGNDYINHIHQIFSDNPPESYKAFDNYDFKLFDSLKDMITQINNKNNAFGLSRIVAGYAWEWKTKKYTYQQALQDNIFDIEIEEERLIWNTTGSGWVMSDNSINEVGSIHTVQGYDLNYIGVIIGPDITYNPIEKKLVVIKSNYFDAKGKVSLENEDELKNYILNIYKVLLTRAIRGTYLYVCDPNLKSYIMNFVQVD